MRAKFVSEALNEIVKYPSGDNEIKLSSGEQAALTKGLELITKPQLATLYLTAKYRLAKREDKSKTFAGAMAQKMNRDIDDEDFRALSYPRLSDMLNMNPLTVSRTSNKFMHLLSGTESYSEVLYPKIIDAFEEFNEMQEGEVWGIAEEALDFNADTKRSEAYNEKIAGQTKASKAKKDKEDKKRGLDIKADFLKFKDQIGFERAVKMTINTFSKQYDVSKEEIKRLAKLAFKGDTYILKYWK